MQIAETMNSRCRMVSVKNDEGLEVTLCDFGASIYEIRLLSMPMTIACKDFDQWMSSRSYFGKTVGRIAGRVKDSKIKIGDKEYQLDANEGKNSLHSGKDALCFKPWIYDIHETKRGAVVDFYYHLEDGEEGLPGVQTINVRYTIHRKKNVLDVKIIAGKPSKDTYTRLTIHPYFNLGGDLTIKDHEFTLDADRVSLFDEGCVATDFVPVPPYLDFRKTVYLGKALSNEELNKLPTKGLDHVFIRTGADNPDYRKDRSLMKKPIAILESKRANLQIFTTFPAITCYADNFPGGGMLTNGNEEEKHSGIALEPRFDDLDVVQPGAFQKKGRLQINRISYVFDHNL